MNIYDSDKLITDMIDKCEDRIKSYPLDHTEHGKIRIQIDQLKSKLKKDGKNVNE